MKEERILAWHFTEGNRLRNGDPLPKIGEVLHVPPPIRICNRGCHASRKILDAVSYAPGSMLHRVELWGNVEEQLDKLVASNRVILWSKDIEAIFKIAARQFALRVIHLWEPEQVVIDYLNTGDEKIRTSAEASAWASARASAWTSAKNSAKNSAWASARASAEASAWTGSEASAWVSAKNSAWASARASAEASGWASSEASAWVSAKNSAWASAEASAEDSAKGSARASAMDEMNSYLESLVLDNR